MRPEPMQRLVPIRAAQQHGTATAESPDRFLFTAEPHCWIILLHSAHSMSSTSGWHLHGSQVRGPDYPERGPNGKRRQACGNVASLLADGADLAMPRHVLSENGRAQQTVRLHGRPRLSVNRTEGVRPAVRIGSGWVRHMWLGSCFTRRTCGRGELTAS
jgi:hypothetical protein